MKINHNARECRCIRHTITHSLQAKEENNNIENQNTNLFEVVHDTSPPSLQHKHEQNSMDIVIRPHIVINLDDDNEIAKIDEQVHNELNSLFSSSMRLNDDPPNKSVELRACPSLALDVFPLSSFPPSIHTDQDWDANDLL